MIKVKKDAIKYKTSNGMQNSGVICQIGTFGVDYASSASIIQFNANSELPPKVTLNLNNVTSLGELMNGVTNVEELTINLKKQCTTMYRMIFAFSANKFKKIVLNFDTSKVTSMMNAFCRITTQGAEIIGELDFSSVTVISGMFDYSSGIKEVRFKKGTLKLSLQMRDLALLSDESIQSIIDGLADLTGQTAQTVQFHSDVKSKLTENQIAQITSKNWTLA